jgi:hypothetical protein
VPGAPWLRPPKPGSAARRVAAVGALRSVSASHDHLAADEACSAVGSAPFLSVVPVRSRPQPIPPEKIDGDEHLPDIPGAVGRVNRRRLHVTTKRARCRPMSLLEERPLRPGEPGPHSARSWSRMARGCGGPCDGYESLASRYRVVTRVPGLDGATGLYPEYTGRVRRLPHFKG